MITANNDAVQVPCRYCGIEYTIFVKREDLASWMMGEGYIQDVLGYLSKAERELIISGTCNTCWQNMFGVDDDEE